MAVKIESLDKNFSVKKEKNEGMISYSIPNDAFALYGIFYDEKEKRFMRMDYETAGKVSEGVQWLSRCTSGGRLRFYTNAKKMELTATYTDLNKMSHMSLLGSSGFTLIVEGKKGNNPRACFMPGFNDEKGFHGSANLSGEMQEYILYFPLYNDVKSLTISLNENAVIKKGNAYRNIKPILYYGSSITQGGCASRPDTCYPALISRWNNIDFINLGFSGNCLGEKIMAEYLSQIECSLFVCDYDHNSPSVEHLKRTQFEVYKIFRSKQKYTPILFLTKPDIRLWNEYKDFRKAIYNNYKKAKAQGDNQVYFLGGEAYYGNADSDLCSVDGCHPNDLGFYKMAKKIYAKMLKINKNFQ